MKQHFLIIIDGKKYCYQGSLDNALFSASRRHNFVNENYGFVYYESISKPKEMSEAAFKRMIENP
jgi:hypothetical protein